jgi:hypothetical protein
MIHPENRDHNSKQDKPEKQTDLLGQEGSDSENFNPRDFSERSLKSVAEIRQNVTKRGGQPI